MCRPNGAPAGAGAGSGNRAIVRVQNPIRLDDWSEPEPDISLLRWRDDFYASGHPGPADVLLVIEVADTSIGYDREVKLPIYARAGIPETWIVDLVRGVIDAYRLPSADGYGERRTHRRGETLSAVSIELGVGVDELLPG